MPSTKASIDIDAPLARVADVLFDFARYGEWNPFIPVIAGEVKQGALLTLHARFHSGRRARTVQYVEVLRRPGDDAELTFLLTGRLENLGLARVRRTQLLTRIGMGRTRYLTTEVVTGMASPLLSLRGDARGYAEVATALKRRAEALHAGRGSA